MSLNYYIIIIIIIIIIIMKYNFIYKNDYTQVLSSEIVYQREARLETALLDLDEHYKLI